MNRKEVGLETIRYLWYTIAQKVVEKAIQIYELDKEQANALRKVYLKPNHYIVISK
jgi:hypothetical protein